MCKQFILLTIEQVKLIINVKDHDKLDRIPNTNAQQNEVLSTTQKLHAISK